MYVLRFNVYAEDISKIIICSVKNQCNEGSIKLGECEYIVPVKDSIFKVFKVGKSNYEDIEKSSLEELERKFGKGIVTEKQEMTV